jgi:hypothetical protein
MPFSPLPATFIDDVQSCAPGGALELGSGGGAFTALLAEHGLRPWTLDRLGPPLGGRPDVVGDAMRPPFGVRFPLVVAANVLRHVWPAAASEGPGAWQDLVAPGGSLWVLEDEPCNRPPSAHNYCRLQDLLADLQPGRHQRLLPLATFVGRQRQWRRGGRWTTGTADNHWPARVADVMAMLASGRPAPGWEVAELLDSLARSGLSYGRYWWARWTEAGSP